MSAERRTFIGGSEIAALFGEHPYLTKYELWMRKAGRLPEKAADERMEAGQFMEPAVAAWTAKKKGWIVYPHSGGGTLRKHERIGGTPDFNIDGSRSAEIKMYGEGPGILEIKTTDWLMAKRWDADDDPPFAWQLQLQHYLGLTGRSWGALGVLVGGNDLRIFEYDFRPQVWQAILAACAEFWASIDAGTPPTPDWTADAATVARIYAASVKGKTVELSGDNRLPALADEYLAAHADEKAAASRKDAARAEILTKIGDADLVTCGAYRINAAAVAPSLGTLVTPEMVGSHVGGRAGYRTVRITRKG